MKTDILMLDREIIVVCSEKYTEHVNRFCGQNVHCFKAKPSGAQSNSHPSPTPNAFIGFQNTHIKYLYCCTVHFVDSLNITQPTNALIVYHLF